ncbi:hypothetical protein [Dokdonella soli]|uniref:OmpA-like domain-containing protein n=1 Tax=Dokdonella soli TaxID=529810 RepID=A0ABP3TPI6_9GAMM
MSRFHRLSAAALLALCLFGAGSASARNEEYERLSDQFDRLASDPVLGQHATAQMDRARAALADLKDAKRRDREYRAYLAERRIGVARASAEAEQLEQQRDALQRENDRLQLAIARRDAAQARAELERQRLQAQIRTEEAERAQREADAARAEGEQASQAAESARAEVAQAKRMADAQAKAAALAKKEAALAAAISGGTPASADKPAPTAANRSMTLPESVFVSGKAALAAGSSKQIAKAVAFANADPARRVRVDVSAGGDRALAQQRAQALRDALVAAGADAKRVTAVGSAAKAKRVELVIQ